MSNACSRCHLPALMTALLILLLTAVPTWAGQDDRGTPPSDVPPVAMPPDVWAAQAFVFAAYPELVGRDLALTLRRDGDAVLVNVVDPNAVVSAAPDPGRAVAPPPAPSSSEARGVSPGDNAAALPLLTARVEFDAGTRLRRYDAYGPLVHEAEQLALQETLFANPRWIDSDADVWLMARGAASTMGTALPAAALAAADAVERQLGVSRQAMPPRFLWYVAGEPTTGTRVFRSRPAWVTEATVSGADGQTISYQFEYEPFGGRLIAVTSQEAR